MDTGSYTNTENNLHTRHDAAGANAHLSTAQSAPPAKSAQLAKSALSAQSAQPKNTDLSIRLADIAEAAALSVGPYLIRAFRSTQHVETKADFHDPVTIHDRHTQRALSQVLYALEPDSLILGEEHPGYFDAHGAERTPTDTDVLWIVDPIDGTANFASGHDFWCVSIGAQVSGQIIAGAIYQPTQRRMFRADSTGAYLNGSAIHVSDHTIRTGVIATEWPSAHWQGSNHEGQDYVRMIAQAGTVRRPGSISLALAEVAAGIYAGATNITAKPWDVAAGIALVRAAGGVYIGVDDAGKTIEDTDLAAYGRYAAANSREVAEFCLNSVAFSGVHPK
ncbi:MAG: inositol monophosphatase family protein [Actinomycetaceae bacterium]|nr:hypothetical protein [Actinomycetaceae bacterium]MDY6083411.1 inositol monophosphatase family protein [Actinomycetaceae bacterium]